MYLSLNSIILLYYFCTELDVNEFEVLIVANVLSSMHAFELSPKTQSLCMNISFSSLFNYSNIKYTW